MRHAEKPVRGRSTGVDDAGHASAASLTPKGWMRAGALALAFRSPQLAAEGLCLPDVLYAAGVGPGSESLRSIQTATPLATALSLTAKVPFVTRYLKSDTEALARSIRGRRGCVLVVWEHKALPEVVRRVSRGEITPGSWPDDCYDRLWILDRGEDGWRFSSRPLALLPEDFDGQAA